MVIKFTLFVSSRPQYQAEFYNIKSSLFVVTCNFNTYHDHSKKWSEKN